MDDLNKLTEIMIYDVPEYVKVIRFATVKVTEENDNGKTYEIPKPEHFNVMIIDYNALNEGVPCVFVAETDEDVFCDVVQLEIKGKRISPEKFAKGFMKALETVAKDEQ